MEFLHNYGMEMAFPDFNLSLTVGNSKSFVSTTMDFPYHEAPLPAAIAEGWNWKEQSQWDPKASGDVAKCFCSLYYTSENVITRHNFGKPVYQMFRVVLGDGTTTPFWAEFINMTVRRGITSMVMLDAPTDSSIEQQPLAAPPQHPAVGKLIGKSFNFKMIRYGASNEVQETALGFVAVRYSLLHPGELEAAIRLTYASHNVTWVGLNSVFEDKVQRYLIINDTCQTYPDKNPKGFMDPIELMASRYQQLASSVGNITYVYTWQLPDHSTQIATMVTPTTAVPSMSVNVTVISAQGKRTSRTLFDYDYKHPQVVDPSIFTAFKGLTCQTVKNFTAPEVCINDWLMLQYECSS